MKLGKNMLVYAIADLLGRSIGLLASPFTTRLLTPEQFGAYPLLLAVWSMVALAQYGGMDSAYPFFRAQDTQGENRQKILVTATFVATGSLFAVWGLFTLAAIVHPWLEKYAGVTSLELILFLLGLVSASLTSWYLYLLQFMHQALPFARINLLGKVAGVVLSLPLMILAPQRDRLIVMLATLLISQSIALVWALGEFKQQKIGLYTKCEYSPDLSRKMLRYGLLLVPGAVVYAFSAVADRLLVGWLSGPEEVAILTLGLSLSYLVLIIKSWFSLVWEPHLVEWISNEKPDTYLPKLQASAIGLSTILFTLVCLSAIWSDWGLALLYPPYYQPTARLIPVIIFGGACSTLSLIAVATVMVANSPKYHLPIYSMALIINCLVGLAIIPKLGALGAVIGTLAAEMFIISAWSIVGSILLKNLKINWSFSLILGGISGLFISFYHPAMFLQQELLERSLLTLLCLTAALFALWRYQPKQGWKQILS